MNTSNLINLKTTNSDKTMALPVCKGKRQGEYCVSYYCLGKEPIGDLHGLYIVCGVYDDLEDAEADAQKIRLKIKDIGGRVRVHSTGYAERLLGDDAKYAANKKLISEDERSLYSIKAQEEAAKRKKERDEIEARRKQLELEQQLHDDPSTLESYAQLHVSRRMLEESIVAMEHGLANERKKLEKLRTQIADRDQDHPEFRDQWRDFIYQKIGTRNMFIFKERTAGDTVPVDVQSELAVAAASTTASSSASSSAC